VKVKKALGEGIRGGRSGKTNEDELIMKQKILRSEGGRGEGLG